MLLAAIPDAITPINDGLDDLQFQSLSFNPKDPAHDVLGGTQDNGTWSFDAHARPWFESVGGDGGQSGFDAGNADIRYHNYFDATPEVNFHGDDPNDVAGHLRPAPDHRRGALVLHAVHRGPEGTPGRLFTGLEHVWRTDDNGGDEADLRPTAATRSHLDPDRADPCGDWVADRRRT